MTVTATAIDIVVVAYNSRDELGSCLEGFAGCDWIYPIVVDNASPDRSFEAVASLEGVGVLRMPRNGGFSYGCNAGWRVGTSPYVLFLNPDAVIASEDLERLAAVLDRDPRVGIVGPRILNEDGRLDYSIRRFPSWRTTYAQALFLHRLFPRADWTDELVRDAASYEETHPVDWLSGACLLVRRKALERIGGFDEGFFLYCEDIDICRRASDAGSTVVYVPEARCFHTGGASHPRAALLPVLAASRMRYSRKHGGAIIATIDRFGIGLGEVLHAVVGRGGRDERLGHLRALGVAVAGREAHRPAGAS